MKASSSSSFFRECVGHHDKIATSSTQLSPRVVKAMLLEENRLRLCDETMQLYNYARENKMDPFRVPELIQQEVARRFGIDEAVAVEAMRCAETLPQLSEADIREVREISHYRKYNRCKDGTLEVGGTVPLDIGLWKVRGTAGASAGPNVERLEAVTLSDVHQSGKPLVIMAASYS